jgi:cytoskeletal protein RodZ
MTATIIPHKTQTSSSKPKTSSKTTPIADHTTATQSPTAGTTTSSAAGNSQTDFNDHSGGGSPFDTAGNMNAAPSVSLSLRWTILSVAAAMLMALR